jgi:hypothetical protein
MKQLRNEEGDKLISTMWDAMQGREQEWLGVAAEKSNIKLPDDAIEHFYYCFVYPLNLEQRIPYRRIVQHACHDLLTYELQSDVRSAIDERSSSTQMHIAVIENWIRHARSHHYDLLHIGKLVESGLIQLRKDYPPVQWNNLAPYILRSTLLTPLPPKMEEQLMSVILSTVSLHQFSTDYLDLYKKYQEHRSLSATEKLVIRAINALTSGVIDNDLANSINKYVTALRPDMYREVVIRCVPEFLNSVVTAENHTRFVSAFMIWTQGWKPGQLNYFWQTYQNVLINLFLQSATTQQSMRLMSFWFAQSPNSYVPLYVSQYFFMILPALFEQARKSGNFNESLRYFQMEASRCYWYPSIQHLLVERKGLLGRIKFGRIKDFILQNEDRVAAEKVEVPGETKRQVQESHTEVMQLFSHKDVVQAHHKYLKKIYPPPNMTQNREQFWSKYWELFIATIADDVRDALALLSFWFDDSFEVLGNVPYVSQEFFIGLVEALESTRKYGKFREVAMQMDDAVHENRGAYKWYTFIVGYLPDVK